MIFEFKSIVLYFLLLALNIAPIDILGQQTIGESNYQTGEKVERIYPGDQLPFEDYEFKHITNYPKSSIKWSDFNQKKIVILDFWNKYCTSCIASFPKLQQLQQKFNDNIQIVLITHNSKEELNDLFKRSYILQNISLPIVFEDTLWSSQLFEHAAEPYHVWISTNGKVIATVNGPETREERIMEYLEGRSLNISQFNPIVTIPEEIEDPHNSTSLLDIENSTFRNRIIYYAQLPEETNPKIVSSAFTSNTLQSDFPRLKQYSMFLIGPHGYYSGNNLVPKVLYNKDGKAIGNQLFSTTLKTHIISAYVDLFKKQTPSGIAELKSPYIEEDAREYIDSKIEEDITEKNRRHYRSIFSYEIVMNDYTEEKARKVTREDIARCFGLRAKLRTLHLSCITFTISDSVQIKVKHEKADQTKKSEIIRSSDAIKVINTKIGLLISEIRADNDNSGLPVIIDATKEFGELSVNMDIPLKDFALTATNYPILKKALLPYGITMHRETKEATLLVIYKNDSINIAH